MRRLLAAPALVAVLGAAAAPSSLADERGGREGGAPLTPAQRERLLADLPDSHRAAVAELVASDARALLEAVFDAGPSYEISTGAIRVRTDPRWFATLPPDEAGAPELVLRRWPGDTLIALWRLADPVGERTIRLPGVRLLPAALERPGEREWLTEVEGGSGRVHGPVRWIQREVEGVTGSLGALLVTGDGGFGPQGFDTLDEELLHVLRRVEVRADRWEVAPPVPRGATLAAPEAGFAEWAADEREDPWQVVDAASFTLGVPPGIRARRLDGAIPAPDPLEGAAVWLRGRFVDRDGTSVAVGDGIRFGYVAEREGPPQGWARGLLPPLAAPRAEPVGGDRFPSAAEETGSRTARAERWREPGFGGTWLVFRLVRDDGGIEIGLPVVEGWRSPALFWIPVSWRVAGETPAPPPFDPAERFGIRFRRLTRLERSDRPWLEGTLDVPGLRLELPRDWWPLVALRSRDGYPLRLVHARGDELGRLVRLEDATAPAGEWNDGDPDRPRGAARRRADGAACWVAADGSGFLLEPAAALGDGERREAWERLVESGRTTSDGP